MDDAVQGYLRWVGRLPDGAGVLWARREVLLGQTLAAAEQEVGAWRLRLEVAKQERELLNEAVRRWGMAAVLRAAREESAVASLSAALRQVRDEPLRSALKHIDGMQLGIEALLAFEAGQVLRLDGARLPTNAEELAGAVERVAQWWAIAGRPVLSRLARQVPSG